MQEFCDSIKRSYLQILGIKEGEEVQAKGIGNLINKIIAEKFLNLDRFVSIHVSV
jgi:hypothetical protein